MNAGPPDQGPSETQETPEPPHSEAAPPPPPEAPPPPPEAPAPYSYAPPPGAMAPPPAPRRGMGPLVAIIGVVIIVIVAVLGYAVVGYAVAQGKLSSAQNTYNTVVGHENKYTDAINALGTKITGANFGSAPSSDLQSLQTVISQFVTQAQAAGPGIESDDQALAKADSDLKSTEWLTLVSNGDINKASTRIGHIRKALADAKVITADYVQVGTFYQAFLTLALDFDALGKQFSATNPNFTAIASALDKLKTDTAKAISLDKAPGLPSDLDAYLKLVQQVTTDLTNLINAAVNGDSSGVDAANAQAQADATKLDDTDFNKISGEIDSFYKPLIDDYNAEIDKANNT